MYYIVFGVLYLISLLPFPILYLLSDFFYIIIYYIAGYRKKVVMKNLSIAFPEKTEAERKAIAKKFYRNFCDNWIEALKLLSMSKKSITKRVTTNFEMFQDIYTTGRPCHILLGHQFNWEWGTASLPIQVPYKVLIAYSPITNKIFDRLFLYLRQRFGSILIPFNDMRRAMLPHRNSQYVLVLVADQNPSNLARSYQVDFLNMPTHFLQGPERGIRLGNIPVVYVSFSRPRRGYYHQEAKILHENPGATKEGELTQLYAQELEKSIRQNPELYLWTHKRWKSSIKY